jgi:hypothetical protein
LYSFAYFNEAISDADLKTFKLYNKYKLYGIHTRDRDGDTKVPVANNKTKLANIEINIPPALVMKDVKDTDINTLTTAKEIANIAKI